MDQDALRKKKEDALRGLRTLRKVVVAFSGGVDSAVLLTLAVEALGKDAVLAATGVSASLPDQDAKDARKLVASLAVRHLEVETGELDDPGYRANAGDRCYRCRALLFKRLKEIAREEGFRHVVYGAISNDLGDFRPGMDAAREAGVAAPLLDAGLTKDDVRALAREAGLHLVDKPASACLSSRIPYGTEVTPERLRQVEVAESNLRRLGFGQVRVRHHGEIGRLELDADGMRRLGESGSWAEVAEAVRAAGFRYATLDLDGYRPGSLNPAPARGASPGPGRS